MKRQQFFVTGTDTEVGKTFVTVALLKKFEQLGYSTLALKPIAAGCESREGQLVNDDALQLIASMTTKLPYEQVNPYPLKSAIAPHLAAQEDGRQLSVNRIVGMIRGALLNKADIILIEGAGGWLVPLNERENLADVVRELQMPVILVVGMRLGCLNHALLTAQAIRMTGLPLAGWVANCVTPAMAVREQNISTLRQRLAAPCLGVIPYSESGQPADIISSLDLTSLPL